MYVRDHQRPQLNAAMGFDATDYDYEVFRITREISTQVFPVTLDIDHPAFRAGMDGLLRAAQGVARGQRRGGVLGRLQQAGWAARGALGFARLYLLKPRRQALPAQVRMAPAW